MLTPRRAPANRPVIEFAAHIQQNELMQIALVENITQTNGGHRAATHARHDATREHKQVRTTIGVGRDEQLANEATHA